MPKKISHKNISNEDAENLYVFFNSPMQQGSKVWHAGQVFTFQDNTEFSFEHTVVKRDRMDSEASSKDSITVHASKRIRL